MPVAMSKASDLVKIHQKKKEQLETLEIASGKRAVGVLALLGAQAHVLPWK